MHCISSSGSSSIKYILYITYNSTIYLLYIITNCEQFLYVMLYCIVFNY